VLLSYELDKLRKRLLVDNNVIKKMSDYIGTFRVVMFSPDDSELIKGYSPQRRRFLDVYLGQINNKYLKDLSNYNRVLKNRNELLKKPNPSEQDLEVLKIYSEALVKYGINLIIERKKFIEMLNPEVAKISLAISNETEKTELKYMPNVEKDDFLLKTFRQLKKDLYLQTTGLGPHKDDFIFEINGKDAASFASQGQQRTSSIALKLGLANLFDKLGMDNIVILDDVFSELDKERQNQIMQLFKEDKQIFITTTTIDSIHETLLENSNIIKIERE
jgi:DNA replication and repair protein RecF